MPVERTKSWSYQDGDMYSTQMVWQAPVASFIEQSPKIVELEDDDLPPLVDAPPLSPSYPPPATFTFVSSGDDFSTDDAPAPRKRAASHSKKRPENHIPRPPNAFILFRSSFIKAQHVSTSIETNHSTLSKIIGLTWKNLSAGERNHWHEEAKRELEKHKKRFPKYAFKPQQTKAKGSGAKGGGGDRGGGGTGKRKVREVEPKDEKRCMKIAELLVQGVKGDELNAKMEEFDRTHVPEIVTRFEAPITESHFQVDDSSFRRGSSAPIEETELKIEQASFLPKAKAPKKVRRSISERPTRASTPQTQTTVATVATPAVNVEHQQVELQQPSFDFNNFSFDATAPSMAYPTAVDPTSSYPIGQQSFSPDLSIDTSFMHMQDWSACSSPVSPSPSFSMPSTPDFGAQSPSPAFASSPSPPPTFTAQMNMFNLNDKSFNDYNQYNAMPAYHQGDGFGGDAYLGVDSYGFDGGMNMDAYNPTGFVGFDAVPQYNF